MFFSEAEWQLNEGYFVSFFTFRLFFNQVVGFFMVKKQSKKN
jgi:hypothetical protein